MAVGYAMYKTLFKNGYPFSYDLREIAQYYIAYRRLMQHWRSDRCRVLIHRVSYEDLVADQRGETRKLLDYCGLEWEEACVAFSPKSGGEHDGKRIASAPPDLQFVGLAVAAL